MGRWTYGLVAATALTASPSTARADLPLGGDITAVALLCLFPHDAGAMIEPGTVHLTMGWSFQIPFDAYAKPVQRIVPEFDWSPTSNERPSRGRLGYRLGWRYPFGGLGLAVDRQGVTWSPELGVRFLHDHKKDDGVNLSAHFIVRGDIAPAVNEVEALTLLVGWGLF